MKKITLLLLLFTAWSTLQAQAIVKHLGISATNIDVTSLTTVGQIDLDIPANGTVVVRFDGTGYASVGDRIVYAASNNGDWTGNAGNVNIEVPNTDQNYVNFSHTQTYAVTPGMQSYYAVSENLVETAGDGITSIYGSLTVEYFEDDPSGAFAILQPISETNQDLTGGPVTLGSITMNAPSAGKVLVRFDGNCLPDVGDQVILAASDEADWNINDGNVAVEVLDTDVNRAPFMHTRVYDVAAGSHTFYAVAENFIETAGDGEASIYGNLLVEFFPNAGPDIIESEGVVLTNIDVSSIQTVATVTVDAPSDGMVEVTFDGHAYATVGDRIILAASNDGSWTSNDGNLGIEAFDTDIRNRSFSHTRVYPVTAGSHDFYGVAQNFIETAGDGTVSIYGSLTAKFFADPVSSIRQPLGFDAAIEVFPNPTADIVQVQFSKQVGDVRMEIVDVNGKLLQSALVKNGATDAMTFDLSSYANGVYFLKFATADKMEVRSVVRQ